MAFLTAYRLALAGNVADDMKRQIKGHLTQALLNGEPLYEVTRKLGRVVDDPEKFRHTGGFVFPSASNRLRLIVDTENNRVHNQGRLAFYAQVGIGRVRWIASGLESMCPICGRHPSASPQLIKKVQAEMKLRGKIALTGRGHGARWAGK